MSFGRFLLVDFGLAQLVRTPNHEVISTSKFTNENLPIDYSKKRKRASESSEEESKGSSKGTKRMALKLKDNNIKILNASKAPQESKNENEKFLVLNRATDATKKYQANKQSPDKPQHKSNILNASSVASSCKKKLIDCSEIKIPLKTPPSRTAFKVEPKFKAPSENSGKILGNSCLTPMTKQDGLTSGSHFQGRSSKILKRQITTAAPQKQIPSTSSYIQGCICSGKGAVCSLCSSRDKMDAPRAGTSGFRAPEVLFRYLYQTTAVDMWASGVVMLCILSGCYPFFNSSTDLVSLAEIMTVFGTERTIKVATKFGKNLFLFHFIILFISHFIIK